MLTVGYLIYKHLQGIVMRQAYELLEMLAGCRTSKQWLERRLTIAAAGWVNIVAPCTSYRRTKLLRRHSKGRSQPRALEISSRSGC